MEARGCRAPAGSRQGAAWFQGVAGIQPVRSLCNPIDMKRVVSNLVINAAQASAAGSEIDVRVYERHGAAYVDVEDDGAGIPPDIPSQVCERHA
jgi:signal transduction histidine kinase